jgi:hypothetical protein
MTGVGLGTGGRKQHRGGQHGRCEEEAREVRQANHVCQFITSRAPRCRACAQLMVLTGAEVKGAKKAESLVEAWWAG